MEVKEMCNYIPYVSLQSYGVDATEFYKQFNMTLTDAARATGITRKSASKIPIYRASKENTEKVILFLEEICAEDYKKEIEQCLQMIEKSIEKIEEAWNDYENKEQILEEYRQKYEIKRNQHKVKKIEWEETINE